MRVQAKHTVGSARKGKLLREAAQIAVNVHLAKVLTHHRAAAVFVKQEGVQSLETRLAGIVVPAGSPMFLANPCACLAVLGASKGKRVRLIVMPVTLAGTVCIDKTDIRVLCSASWSRKGSA
eukprot:TRINITY_DN9825_c0_g4_i2.p2 TRINITY_DN9825_c0_g4~~TRINITY_DN9825_c0_g4_i2.p2  ORF type:complete len:122 (+),score=18.74 TRINITY_DN9825_c0_g4_i2:317-682(+)